MDLIAFLRKLSLVRLFFESLCLIIAMMALTAHGAARARIVIVNTNDPGDYHRVTDMLDPEMAVCWLLFYFLVPRTIVGWYGVLCRHSLSLAAHIVLSSIILVMYCVVGLVCVFVESSVMLMMNFVVLGIEVSTILISYRLLQDARSKGGSGDFDWRRFLGEQVTESSPA